MIARDTGGGRSFQGAGLYYLHDRDAESRERVAFTHTENLLTDDPEKAMKVMAWTASHQADLKRAAGVPATGRKLANPVHTFVFAWAKDEAPEPAHMTQTARSAMEALGLQEHEAVYVGHDDTEHRHVHVIVNRVHPETGKASSLSHAHRKLSTWAEAYEREHGVRCHRRIENNRRRAEGARVIDLESRRRNAEQFADWRGERKRAAGIAHEKQRFEEWAARRQADLERGKLDRLRALERAQDARKAQAEARFAQAYDTRTTEAHLSAVEASLARKGLPGLWGRLSGRRARESAQKEALEKTIAEARQRLQEARQAVAKRAAAEKAAFLVKEAAQAQELAQRVENARARREREGWTGFGSGQPRPQPAPAREQDNVEAFKQLREQWVQHGRDRGPGRGR